MSVALVNDNACTHAKKTRDRNVSVALVNDNACTHAKKKKRQ